MNMNKAFIIVGSTHDDKEASELIRIAHVVKTMIRIRSLYKEC